MSNLKPELLPRSRHFRRKRAKTNILGWLLAGTLIAVITLVTLAYTYYSARAGLININVVKEMPQASILYDYQGRAFSRFFDENRIALPTDQPVPKLLGEAVVATEDRRFYHHGAIDLFGMARAAVSNLIHRGGRQGGSTITQQLARNSIGQLQRTYDRKLLEIFLAHRIELAYTKQQILRYYLDRIYFGQGLYGAETTAYAFFGVPASKLNLAQCALLAGMISSPNASSPWKDIDQAKAARDRALDRMVKAGYITQTDADKAQKAPLALRPRPDFGGGFATSEVRRQLETILDSTTIQQGGLKIFTTIDPRLQGIAENALATRILDIEKSTGQTHPNGYGDPNTGLPDEDILEGAFFAMDPTNGAIRAVVGSRDFTLSQYNRAMQARRQVGSTLKPLIYATAFAEKNYCPASAIDASKFDLTKAQNGVMPAGDSPDYIRINDALVRSDDYAAVRMGIIIGPDLLNSYAHQCGVTTDIPPYPSSYLGACDISLNELTGIYATFADQGVWVRQHIVVQVKDEQDRVIYEFKPEGRRVFTPQVARQVTGMMQNVLDFGTGSPVREEYGFTSPAAGKTGTTNDYKDALFEGFTSRLVAGVWIGYDTPREIMPGGYGATVALPIWASVMKQMKDSYPMTEFPVPNGLTAVNVGGGFFGRGERYYLTPAQRALLDQEPNAPTAEDNGQAPTGRSIFDRFLDLFR
ncbi:MAG: transglycosylase domain-containing protein [Methylacidiphilales bacterium]|nr:transglycosylase domain-containing protein [Candidatus Methylacidiphilales bacterium]